MALGAEGVGLIKGGGGAVGGVEGEDQLVELVTQAGEERRRSANKEK